MYIIGGLYKNRRLTSPKSNLTRPTSAKLRESLFNICQNYIADNHFLDIFAGSGAMGLEALSRGAKTATFIDINRQAVQCIKKNAALLGVENQCEVLCGQVTTLLKLLSKHNRQFDLIYADPPYNTSLESEGKKLLYSEYIIHSIDQSHLLAPGGTLFIEEDGRYAPTVSTQHLILKESRKFGHTIIQIYEKSS